MSKSTIWLSYDLGVRGDYDGLYAWLDGHQAKECGDSLAVFQYPYTDKIADALKAELRKSVTTDKRTRIYVIYRERISNKLKGTFVLGGRRAAPWTGYAATPGTSDDEV